MLNPNTILYFIYEDEDEDEDGGGGLRVKIERERENNGKWKQSKGSCNEDAVTDRRRSLAQTTHQVHHSLGPYSPCCSIPHRPKGTAPTFSSLLFSSNSLYPFFSIFLIGISVCLFISFQGTKHPEILIITSISGHSFANNNLNKLIIRLS